ncbi:unnamed protein product [Cladocopium goreaui]|uniref:Uncharacterized protein n=1 Tax=Cladocopium goreaui TaxID=2562237 RepID=A0A9P1BY76_9DINO|nr:unnamed protein product [Cladocopium goreaui]
MVAMAATASYLQCIGLIFFWSFKPSEPHLSAYLVEVKHFSKHQRDAEIYTVYSYGSLVVVTLCALVKVYTLRLPNFKGLGNKALILLGAGARVATRVLLLYGTTLWQMQLMQVAFSVGLVGEFAFYAYCLKVIPGESQRLTALVQSSYLVSHTLAGLLGDWLLHHTDLGLVGLLWIAAVSVFLSCPLACSLKEVDKLDRPAVSPKVLWGIYSSPRYFWLSTLWWVLSYPAYQTIYGYESSLYADRFSDAAIDHNGSIFAVALLCGALSSATLSWHSVERRVRQTPTSVFVLLSCLLSGSMVAMGWFHSEWNLALSFTVFFILWSFANALFYGETRRSVDAGLDALHLGEQERKSITASVVSTVFMLNSAVGTLVNGIISFVAFNCLDLSVERVFQAMAILQGSLTVLVIGLALGVQRVSSPRSYQEMARVGAVAVPVTAVGFDPQTPPTEAEQVS